MSYSKYKVDISKKGKQSRTVFDEHSQKTYTFDSATEMKYYTDVVLPKFKSGEIVHYELQKKYILQDKFTRPNGDKVREIYYDADFYCEYSDGHIEIRDTKGSGQLVDNVAKVKRKLFWNRYPDLDFEWTAWTRTTGWAEWDYLQKLARNKKKNKD